MSSGYKTSQNNSCTFYLSIYTLVNLEMQREQVMDNETNKKKTGHFFFRDPRSVSARILWHQLLSNVLFLGTPSNIRYYWEPWWLILTAQWTCLRDIWGIREVRLWAFQWGWFQRGSVERSRHTSIPPFLLPDPAIFEQAASFSHCYSWGSHPWTGLPQTMMDYATEVEVKIQPYP